MFKKILGIFYSEDAEQESSTSRENEIKQLIMIHKRRLAKLERQQARTDSDISPMIAAEIEEIKQKIVELEAKSKEPDEFPASKMSDNLRQQYDNAEAKLKKFCRELETAANELEFVPEASQPGAIRLVDIGKRQLPEFEEEWNNLGQQQPASEDILRAFISRITTARTNLSILVRRGIYRRNLGMLEEQRALRQSALDKDALETILRPQMDFELEKITTLEERELLDTNEQKRLAIHRNNLNLYQEMLSGQRPYAPLSLVNQVGSQKQAIQDIDNQLANL